jgi:hypothetical protein
MPIIITFDPKGGRMSADQYDALTKKLETSGFGKPKGRLFHTSYGDATDIHVTDVWDSMENFEAFGKTLMPLLQQAGIDPGQPVINSVHNYIKG